MELFTEKRIRAPFLGVAGQQNTDPKMPRVSRASRNTRVRASLPAIMETIWDRLSPML
jgi:hypothetical protein